MIYSVTGKLVHVEPELAVISCGGVGFGCRTTLTTIQDIQDRSGEVTLLTHLVVREDAMELFGFSTSEELNWFELLITVSGVGPKAAITILSGMTVHTLAIAIASEDVKAFTRIKGVGAKTAQRIVLELKSKVTKDVSLLGKESSTDFTSVNTPASSAAEAVAALVSLGYSQSDAATAIAKLDGSLSVEALIKAGLRALAGM